MVTFAFLACFLTFSELKFFIFSLRFLLAPEEIAYTNYEDNGMGVVYNERTGTC